MSSRGIVVAAFVGFASALASGQGGWGGAPERPDTPPPPRHDGGDLTTRVAQTQGAPAWARPGASLLYYGGSSNEDSQGKVHAGAGFTRFDLVAIDGERVYFQTSSYIESGLGPGYIYSGGPMVVVGPAETISGNGLWKPIADLRSMRSEGDNNAARQIVIEKWPVGNRTVDAVIEVTRERDSIRRVVFDLEQGTKLNESLASGPMRRQGGENFGFNRRDQNTMSFDSMEVFNPPWAGGQTPPWARTVRSMSYRGSFSMHVDGLPPLPVPMSHEFTITERGDGWESGTARYGVQSQGQPQQDTTSPFVQGPGSRSAYWYDPQKLRAARPGVVHRNAKLGITMRYDIDGRIGVVTESSDAGAYRAQWFYSLDDGALVRVIVQQRDTAVTTTLDLVGRN